MKATIITIGDELLIGTTIDTNSAYIGRSLQSVHIDVSKKCTIGDKREEIISVLDTYIGHTDYLIFTGGLGPTKDDITKKTIAIYLQKELVIDETTLRHVAHFFERRNRPMLDVNKDQALVIDGCDILFNRLGTAPGMLVSTERTTIIILPGVPFEMRTIWDEEVLPRLSQHKAQQLIIHRYIETAGIGESFIAKEIADIEDALPPYIKLAYLPSLGGVTLRLTAKDVLNSNVLQEIEAYHKLIVHRIQEWVYATELKPLASHVIEILKSKRLTIATAESCTGGGLSSAITDISGASAVYMGSIISYGNTIKQEVLNVRSKDILSYGAVSEPVVIQMAEHGRKVMNTDICISISGILGPDTDDTDKKVGLVFVAIAIKNKPTVVKEFNLPYDRLRNKELLIVRCLDLLRITLNDIDAY